MRDHLNNEQLEGYPLFFALCELYEESSPIAPSPAYQSQQDRQEISVEDYYKMLADLCDPISIVGDDSKNNQEPQSNNPATDAASGSNNEKKYYCLKPCLIFFSLAALSFAAAAIALEVNLLIAGLLLSLSIFLIAIGFSFISGSSFLKPYTTCHSSQNDLTPNSVEADQSNRDSNSPIDSLNRLL
jgi:hypothetical protein